MNRYIPLLLCLFVGCASANGSFIAKSQPKKVSASRPAVIQADPVPPTPNVVPTVSLPENVTVKIGMPVFVTATTNCENVIWLDEDPTDDLWVMPGGMLNDAHKYTTMVIASAPGEYRLKAIAAMNSTPVMSDWCIITVLGPQPPPPGPGPKPPVPPIPPDPPAPAPVPVTSTNLLIYTFDDANARTPAVTAMLFSPYWISLQNKGHKFEKFNTTNAGAMAAFKTQIDANGGLPCIVIMDLATRKWLNKDPADLKLPADQATLQARIARYTGNLP